MFKILNPYEAASVPLTKKYNHYVSFSLTALAQVSSNIYGYDFAFDRLSIH